MTFAEKLRQLREAAGLTQAALADRAGVPIGSVRNYEQGQREPYWDVVFKLAEAVGVSVEEFRECLPAPPPAEPAARPKGRPKAGQGPPPVEPPAKPAPARGRKRKGT